jgi:hypothetical protein
MAHLARPQTLGVDPRLVLVFELNDPVDLEDFRKADLLVLDASQENVVVAFADDPQLASFLERLDRYRSGPSEGRQRPPLEPFFDAIDATRRLRSDEKLTPRLVDYLRSLDSHQELRLDVECWHPGEERTDEARTWLEEVVAAVEATGGRASPIAT